MRSVGNNYSFTMGGTSRPRQEPVGLLLRLLLVLAAVVFTSAGHLRRPGVVQRIYNFRYPSSSSSSSTGNRQPTNPNWQESRQRSVSSRLRGSDERKYWTHPHQDPPYDSVEYMQWLLHSGKGQQHRYWRHQGTHGQNYRTQGQHGSHGHNDYRTQPGSDGHKHGSQGSHTHNVPHRPDGGHIHPVPNHPAGGYLPPTTSPSTNYLPPTTSPPSTNYLPPHGSQQPLTFPGPHKHTHTSPHDHAHTSPHDHTHTSPHGPHDHTHTSPHGPHDHTHTSPHGPHDHTHTSPHGPHDHTHTSPHGPHDHTHTSPHRPGDRTEGTPHGPSGHVHNEDTPASSIVYFNDGSHVHLVRGPHGEYLPPPPLPEENLVNPDTSQPNPPPPQPDDNTHGQHGQDDDHTHNQTPEVPKESPQCPTERTTMPVHKPDDHANSPHKLGEDTPGVIHGGPGHKHPIPPGSKTVDLEDGTHIHIFDEKQTERTSDKPSPPPPAPTHDHKHDHKEPHSHGGPDDHTQGVPHGEPGHVHPIPPGTSTLHFEDGTHIHVGEVDQSGRTRGESQPSPPFATAPLHRPDDHTHDHRGPDDHHHEDKRPDDHTQGVPHGEPGHEHPIPPGTSTINLDDGSHIHVSGSDPSERTRGESHDHTHEHGGPHDHTHDHEEPHRHGGRDDHTQGVPHGEPGHVHPIPPGTSTVQLGDGTHIHVGDVNRSGRTRGESKPSPPSATAPLHRPDDHTHEHGRPHDHTHEHGRPHDHTHEHGGPHDHRQGIPHGEPGHVHPIPPGTSTVNLDDGSHIHVGDGRTKETINVPSVPTNTGPEVETFRISSNPSASLQTPNRGRTRVDGHTRGVPHGEPGHMHEIPPGSSTIFLDDGSHIHLAG
ncbi:hypothetical protein Pmani_032060 [Petrolisthes manimaculis]|uniref:Uncharacterized protein n=1 Tax=Petrolisthes manimaculis TaxID=1843537 RepID=A0AAE1TS06_9EUCA|nr:hypothetical protein Pmani_032060 [Petrolisthes manimaculis]